MDQPSLISLKASCIWVESDSARLISLSNKPIKNLCLFDVIFVSQRLRHAGKTYSLLPCYVGASSKNWICAHIAQLDLLGMRSAALGTRSIYASSMTTCSSNISRNVAHPIQSRVAVMPFLFVHGPCPYMRRAELRLPRRRLSVWF